MTPSTRNNTQENEQNQRGITVEVCDPDPLTEEEKSALIPCLKDRRLNPELLDIITNIPHRTRIVKVRSERGELLGLTSILLAPTLFMKHCFGQGNHLGTNNSFFFTGTGSQTEVLTAMFKKFVELKPFGFYIGFLDDDMAGDFRSALEGVPHVVADKIMVTGSISTADPDAEQLLLRNHKHLSRQVHRFSNKGGTIHFHQGPVGEDLVGDFVDCCLDSYRKNAHPGRNIDVDGYGDHVRKFITTFPSILSIYARRNGKVVGVQIFIRHERHLELTEGGFLSQTYHAYENIILASVRYAVAQGLDRVSYGLILNRPKDRLMDKDTRKPVFLVMFFRDEVDPSSLRDYREKAHERFPMLSWRDRSSFPDLPI